MADPQHVPDLDGFDRMTVHLYRAGLVVASMGLVIAGLLHLRAGTTGHVFRLVDWLQPVMWFLITLGAGMAVQHMHLYDKRVRWLIGASCWIGAILQLAATLLPVEWTLTLWIRTAGLGFVFVTLSGFALKEQFCFRIPFLRLVPLMLAGALIPVLGGWHLATGVLLLAAGAVFFTLAVAKSRMPLHFDVGDKSRYQI